MNARTKQRAEPYVWVSWLTRLLAGESSCVWSTWFRAHHLPAKQPTDFDLGAWQVEHSAMLRKTAAEHRQQGHTVYTEGQNLFALKGRAGTLAGKPDIVAVRETMGLVTDTKTGSPKASDRVQVMIYMWALPKTNPAFAGLRFDGQVIYKTGHSVILAEEVDAVFIKRVGDLMTEVCREVEPSKAPSFGECRSCPLTPEDCADRVESAVVYQGETDEF